MRSPRPSGVRVGAGLCPRPFFRGLMEVSIGPDTLLRGTRSRADTQVRPYAGEGEVPATTRASGAQRSVCASGCEEMGGNHGRDHPQSAYQHRTIPQSRLRRTSSLYTRGPWDGGYGLPRRFAPRNDSPKPLSFQGGPTGRRGNPSFLRWTGDGPPRSSAPTGPRDCRGSA